MSNALRQTRFDQLPQLPGGVNSARRLAHRQRSANMLGTPVAGPPALKYVDHRATPRKASAMVKGLRELQELQKQTIAVLESVRGNLEDIRQVLRSPEATRGMEKQQNAAALLGKGFAAEAATQARDAVALLPANPDAYLLLSLSLAADQQFDAALEAAKKGLALFDRGAHALAIEAGLLHALAALGEGPEAASRWQELVTALPVPTVLFELGRIALCYPGDAPEAEFDRLIARRLNAEPSDAAPLAPEALMAGLTAAAQHRLGRAHRAMLVRVAWQAKALEQPADVVRFIGEFCVPLAEHGLTRSSNALAKRAIKQLLAGPCDAMVAQRALLKLELARCQRTARSLAKVLWNWRAAAVRARRERLLTWGGGLAVVSGALMLAQGVGAGAAGQAEISGLALVLAGAATVAAVFFMPRSQALMARQAGALAPEEMRFLAQRQTRACILGLL